MTEHPLAARLRAADPRVEDVARAFLAQRLGLGSDALELLNAATVLDLLTAPGSVVLYTTAQRLLARLDAAHDRAHPVDLERWPGRVVARVLVHGDPGDPDDPDEPLSLVLADGRVTVQHAANAYWTDLSLADTESLGYALLRLVRFAREDAP